MDDINARIHMAKVEAAERAVIDSIPKDIRARLEQVQREFRERGGCPGCKSMVLGAHIGNCPTSREDLY